MPTATPAQTIELHFDDVLDRKPIGQCLSGIAFGPDRSLWAVSDESACIERLRSHDSAGYRDHRRYHLDDFFALPGPVGDEIDLEAIAYDEGDLWVVGSHARRFPKKEFGHELRANRAIRATRRCLIGRIPLVDGEPVSSAPDGRIASVVSFTKRGNLLTDALNDDPFLAPYLELPSKANGLDIEALAVHGHRVALGLRGPVLHEQAVLLELIVKPRNSEPREFRLRKLDGERRYRRHFLNLDGLGFRSMAFHNDDLLILAGPTMGHDGPFRVFVLPESDFGSGKAHEILEIPSGRDCDRPEGIAPVTLADGSPGLAVVYDTPSPTRAPHLPSVTADLFRL
jgi:Protein of unknown function (DUF3616)